jgi:hypothetical protein
MRCPRQHFWKYERRLEREQTALALTFGKAWHMAMEQRWNGEEIAPDVGDMDEYEVQKLGAMIAGYMWHWQDDPVEKVYPESRYVDIVPYSRHFQSVGVIDGAGVLKDGRQCMVEHKTTADNIDPDSDYWLRLRADLQVREYLTAMQRAGWSPSVVVYDVARKPGIRPKQVPLLDDDGLKIVLDNEDGARVFGKNGKPRQSAGQDMTLQTRDETPDEYGERLRADIMERPAYYFQRRELPVMDDDLEEYQQQKIETARMIIERRRKEGDRPERAWPRNVSTFHCPWCEYNGFCMSNATPDLAHPPAGYTIGEVH